MSTPNGYDPRWVEAINGALEDREADMRIDDLPDGVWDNYVGPMLDAIERLETESPYIHTRGD